MSAWTEVVGGVDVTDPPLLADLEAKSIALGRLPPKSWRTDASPTGVMIAVLIAALPKPYVGFIDINAGNVVGQWLPLAGGPVVGWLPLGE